MGLKVRPQLAHAIDSTVRVLKMGWMEPHFGLTARADAILMSAFTFATLAFYLFNDGHNEDTPDPERLMKHRLAESGMGFPIFSRKV